MKNTIFEGSAVAICTPFTENGVNYEEFKRLIEFQIENHTDAIVVCGTTGEPCTMPHDEHVKVIEFAVKCVNGRIPVIAGTGSNDTLYGMQLSKEAEKAGADALLLVTPYYNKTSQRGLINHFNMIADSVNIPMIIYNVPSRTGLCITPETMLELSKHKNIVAIKEASGNISLTAKIASLCGEYIDIYSGNDDMNVPIMSLGAKGSISVLANVAPQKTHDMIKACLDGDYKKATKLQLESIELINALFCEVNPIPAKAALKLIGFDMGPLRAPLIDISDENLKVLKSAMKNYGLI